MLITLWPAWGVSSGREVAPFESYQSRMIGPSDSHVIQLARLAGHEWSRSKSPVVCSHPELRRARWVATTLVVREEHCQLTAAGRLRSASFPGLRDDKAPEECTWV